jgi:5-methylcytosine-specific restriction endonuclease McrA
VYRSKAWAAVKPVVLERDAWVCKIGLPGCKTVATSVDHIVELEDGGEPFALENLQAACISCNVAKGNKARRARKYGRTAGSTREW